MNNMSLIVDKYLNNSKNNIPYFIVFSFIRLFSIFIVLGILFINYYSNDILINNQNNRLFEVNIGSFSKDEAISIFNSNKNIINFNEKDIKYNSKNELINTSFTVEIENLKNTESFIYEMNNSNFEVVISNESVLSQSSIKVLNFFNTILFILYFILLIIFLYVCYIYFRKELNDLIILRFIGYTSVNIFMIIISIIMKVIKKNVVFQLLTILLLFCIFNMIRIFIIENWIVIICMLILNQVFYIISLIILEIFLIKKYCKI